MALFQRSAESLAAYFDESMTNERLPITSVAGYLFDPDAYLAFEGEMKAILEPHGIAYFRMSECVHATGEFKGKDGLCDPIERSVIQIIRKYAILGVGASINAATYQIMNPIEGHESVYNALCQWCLWEVGRWADRNNFNGKVAYFFEEGDGDQNEADHNLKRINLDTFIKLKCRYGSHTFIPKIAMKGLQAGDSLAWFVRREAEDQEKHRVGGTPRNRRKDFQALIGNTEAELHQIEHRVKPFTTDSLREFFKENSFPGMRWYS